MKRWPDSTEMTIEAPCIENMLGLVGHHLSDLVLLSNTASLIELARAITRVQEDVGPPSELSPSIFTRLDCGNFIAGKEDS